MARYMLRRVGQAALVVAGVVVVTFVVMRLVPGDPAVTYAGPRASAQQLERVREELGLDRPIAAQLWPPALAAPTACWRRSRAADSAAAARPTRASGSPSRAEATIAVPMALTRASRPSSPTPSAIVTARQPEVVAARVLAVAGGVACWLPARRALSIRPSEALSAD